MIEREREDTLIGIVQERAGGLLDPQPVDESEQRLSGDRTEHAMEVERGEGGHPGQCRQRQLVGEMAPDVIDDAIDASLVLEPMSAGQGSGADGPTSSTGSYMSDHPVTMFTSSRPFDMR